MRKYEMGGIRLMNFNIKNMTKRLLALSAAAVIALGTVALAVPIQVQAAGRSVSINSVLINNGNVTATISSAQVPGSDGNYYLFADEVYQDGPVGQIVGSCPAGASGQITFPLANNTPNDMLFKKFIVCVKQGGSYVQVSDEHYIQNPEGCAGIATPRNDHGIKGLLLDPTRLDSGEIEDLGIDQVSYNIYLGDIVGETTNATFPTVYYDYDGIQYAFNGYGLSAYDGVFKRLTDKGLQLTVNILNGSSSIGTDLIHPLARDGHVAPNYAFNTAEPAGTKHLQAIASFLGQRYNGIYNCGKVDNWIVGNEVNARTEQYYTSSADLDTNVNIYQKAFRIFYNGITSQNPTARIYNSIDQEWGRKSNPGSFLAKEYLDRFNWYIRREGNINWGLSYHPYNSPLYDPYAWLGYDVWVHKDLATPYITMQNLYILTDYMSTPEFLAPDGQVRSISLSEIGFTSSFGDDKQCASIVYGYLQAAANPHVDSFLLFRQTDSDHEIKSNIAQGLVDVNGNRKPAYDFYKAMGTPQQQTYKDKASAIIGQNVDSLIGIRDFQVRGGWKD